LNIDQIPFSVVFQLPTVVQIPYPQLPMEIHQFFLGCLSHTSYLITDARSATAAVVDPQRDIAQYLENAAKAGCTIKHVFLTHFHADFLAGHIELRDKVGAKIYLGRVAETEYPVTHVSDGDRVEFGDVRLQILETPGHTPEGISILVFDLAKNSSDPYAVLTGDTLFIGDVGRPDLLSSIGVTADALADMLYDSLRQKLMKLPDATLVYPAHGAGSLCGKNMSTATVSTIGEQKTFNYALQPMDRAEFKAIVTAEQTEAPRYFAEDAKLNRLEHPTLDATLAGSLRALSVDEVLQRTKQGTQLLDVRDAIDFEGAYLAGAINIGIQGKYATWCGTILDRNAPIIVIADPGREEEAVIRLGRIGFDNVQGYLSGGMDSLKKLPDLVRRIDRITAVALADLQKESQETVVLDVRSEREWSAGHIQGSVNLPLNHLRERASELPSNQMIVVHCEGGYRSAIAASILAGTGRSKVMDLVGGFKAWTTSQLPIAS
jgi:glyoxylase-like metal-dependent hydrolase (beta-lactamase superfamily II)/rhodanese-related sulfurtransferase